MLVGSIKLGDVQTNCYLLDAGEGRGVLIDAGLDPEALVRWIESKKLAPEAILVTHGHVDHIFGIEAVRRRWCEAKIVIGRDDARALTNPMINASFFFGMKVTAPKADRLLDDGDTVEIGRVKFRAIHTPGHRPGSICFYAEEMDGKPALFSGDTLFRETVGRTDIPDGDEDALVKSIREKLLVLPGNTVVYPGHGPSTTIAHEKKHNPFFATGSE